MAYHLERGRMSLHDAVVENCDKHPTNGINAQVPKTRAKGCMLDKWECII